MIQFKKGVDRLPLQPVMHMALSRVEEIYNGYGYSAVVTSTNDGKHMEGSLHYVGLAADFRIKHIEEALVSEIFEKIVDLLTSISPCFQCILETTHIHVEFDRRKS